MDITNISSMGLPNSTYQSDKTQNSLKNFEKVLEEVSKESKQSIEKDEKLKEACQQFEAYFLYTMFKEMDKTVMKSDLIPEGRAEKMFKDMMYNEMATEASKGKGAGLADMMYKQLSKTYGVSSK